VELLNNRAKFFSLVIGLVLVALAGYCFASRVVVTYGDSIDKHVFFKTSDNSFQTGQYVVIKTDETDPFAKGKLITKKIGCSPGEVLKIVGDDYFCNEEWLGRAKHYSRTGIPVKPFNPCNTDISVKLFTSFNTSICERVVPEGSYFVIGTNKDSYDSRYFGFVSKEKIVSKVIPLW
jgi:signal peptidase I